METTPLCPSCGKPLPANAPKGLCPECLMKGAFPTGTQAGGDDPAHRRPPRFIPPKPEELARFFPALEILEFIGQGGMGAVYKARQKELDRIVALKILPPAVGRDADFAERFAREAKALARLNHPNIVTLFEFGHADGLFFFLMEYVDGVTLRQLLNASRISPREALAIVPQICDALQFAHDRGIVHRDIKPENVLLDKQGRVKIADFGIAKLVEEAGGKGSPSSAAASPTEGGASGTAQPAGALTDTGVVMGTPHFMAPEQMTHSASVDHRADIYAVGVVFYQMLTGELPGQPIEPPSHRVRIDVRLDEVVLRALEQNPRRRYQQASDVKTALETFNTAPESHASSPRPNPSWEAAHRTVRPAATALLVLGILGLVVSVLLVVRGWSYNTIHLSLGPFGYWRVFVPLGWSTAVAVLVRQAGAFCLLAVVGAMRMRKLEDYRLAVVGAIAAMIAPTLLPFGLVIGVWALLVLFRKPARREFDQWKPDDALPSQPTPRLSRLAAASAALAAFSILFSIVSSAAAILEPGALQSGPSGWFMWILESWFMIRNWPGSATILLGAIALEDIRRSPRHLRGAGLAMFGLLYPPCNWVMGYAFWQSVRPIMVGGQRAGASLLQQLLSILIAAGLAWWMHRHELRRLEARATDSTRGWWWLSKPAVRSAQLIAFALFILDLSLSGVWTMINHQAGHLPLQSFVSYVRKHELNSDRHLSAAMPTGRVDLISISDISSARPISWKPDGSPLQGGMDRSSPYPGRKSGARSLVLAASITSEPPRHSGLRFEMNVAGHAVESPTWESTEINGSPRTFIEFVAEPGASRLDFRIGDPAGSWQDTEAVWVWNGKFPRQPERIINHSGEQMDLVLPRVVPQGDGVQVYWLTQSLSTNCIGRIVAVEKRGVTHKPSSQNWDLMRNMVSKYKPGFMETFKDMSVSQLREFRYQVRPLHWVAFHNISLQPGQKTSVEIVKPQDQPAPASSK